ncbi:calcium-binding protein [Roseobacter denitrificans]|uniref:calcium-binding protein n=1 Tax=Roseobacter denitrificans TaxID=2434 RepID=UPI0008EA121F|nr:calcium-binding protein [Roseobacter denitrificans]SFG10787.1 Ca2+-binding protein, RTX toxin-related [Roseobacter denitrificans OCh 114]
MPDTQDDQLLVDKFNRNRDLIKEKFEKRKAENERLKNDPLTDQKTLDKINATEQSVDDALDILQGEIDSIDKVKDLHYARQSLVDPTINDPSQIINNENYKPAPDFQNAFHKNNGADNNVKYTGPDGQEFIIGTDENGNKFIDTTPENVGTPNFFDKEDLLGHYDLDVEPFIRFGNTEEHAQSSTRAQRQQAFNDSVTPALVGKAGLTDEVEAVKDVVENVETGIENLSDRVQAAQDANEEELRQNVQELNDALDAVKTEAAALPDKARGLFSDADEAADAMLAVLKDPNATEAEKQFAREQLSELGQGIKGLAGDVGKIGENLIDAGKKAKAALDNIDQQGDLQDTKKLLDDVQSAINKAKAAAQGARDKINKVGADVTQIGTNLIERARQKADDLQKKFAEVTDRDSDGDTDAADILKAIGDFGRGILNASPLVLDLDGDGIELISLDDGGVLWDLTEDGFAEFSGWVSADDGLLALDVNGNGRIDDNSELFGSQTIDGFRALRGFDDNADGVIDSADAVFDQLLLWQDSDLSGTSEAAELTTLMDRGILSIDAIAQEVNQTNAGHRVSHISTYTRQGADGAVETRVIEDIWFNYNPVITRYSAEFELDESVLWLPDVRGYGQIADMAVALSLGLPHTQNLRTHLEDFAGLTYQEIFADPDALVERVREILFDWAGVADVGIVTRGPNIDGRAMVFLEKLNGQNFLQRGWNPDPGYYAAQELLTGFHSVVNSTLARIVLQTDGNRLFVDGPVYDTSLDSFSGGTQLDVDVLRDIRDIAQASGRASEIWTQVVRTIEFGTGLERLNTTSQNLLDSYIQQSDPTLDLSQIEALLPFQSNVGINLTGNNNTDDVLTGTVGDDRINGRGGNDTIEGGVGADIIFGGTGNDDLYGDAGPDLIYGDSGDDTYHYSLGNGVDTYDETGTGLDRILFGAGITLADLEISRVSNLDMRIAILNAQNAEILIENQFNYGSGQGHIELLEFADGSTYRLDDKSYHLVGTKFADTLYGVARGALNSDTISGGDGNDVIYAFGPNEREASDNYLFGDGGDDYLVGARGSDTIEGGTGEDVLLGSLGNDLLRGGPDADVIRGEDGDDTIFYALGDGDDTLFETGGVDVIEMGAGITLDMLSFVRTGADALQIDIAAPEGGRLTLASQFASAAGFSGAFETLRFADGTEFDLTTAVFETIGTDGDDIILGIRFGGSSKDVIRGRAGNDTIYAYGANERDFGPNALFGEEGDDTLFGALGDDRIEGGAGQDTLDGDAGQDLLDGGVGDDLIRAGTGDDTVFYALGDGDDTLTERNGQDVIVFGPGISLDMLGFTRLNGDELEISIDSVAGGILLISTQFDYASGYSGAFDILRFDNGDEIALADLIIETRGTDGDDILNGIVFGGSRQDVFFAGDGHDTIYAQGPNFRDFGPNTLNGEGGRDELWGAEGNDTLIGGADVDTVYGDGGDDLYIWEAGDGADIMYDRAGWDGLSLRGVDHLDQVALFVSGDHLEIDADGTVLTSQFQFGRFSGLDWVETRLGIQALLEPALWHYGTGAAETLDQNELQASVIFSGQGNDTITGRDIGDVIYAQEGDDTINAGGGNDDVIAGAGADLISTGDGNDRIFGTVSDLNGDVISDFEQQDVLIVSSSFFSLQTVYTTGSAISSFDVDGDGTVDSVITLQGSFASAGLDFSVVKGTTEITLGSGSIQNLIVGSIVNDFLTGTVSSDKIEGLTGNDRILGFDGQDVLSGGVGGDVLNGGDDNDEIRGGDGNDTMYGGSGDDDMEGGAGDDLLIGNAGDDNMFGGLGNDMFRGGTGSDVIEGGDGDDEAFGGDGNDTLRGGEGNDVLDGSAGNDFIAGENGDDTLVGQVGMDTLVGGDGLDELRGGGGNDLLYGDNGNDILFGGANEDRLFGGEGDDFLQGNQQNDELNGENGNDRLFGGDGFDFLDGGSGNDRLEGGNGLDILVGGLGADVLLGNAQNDIYQFNSVEESNPTSMDVIVGMDGVGVAGGDRIDLSNIDANALISGNQTFTFLGLQTTEAGLSFGAGGFWLENAGGPTLLYANTDDDDVIEFAIQINDGAGTSSGDYILGDFIV